MLRLSSPADPAELGLVCRAGRDVSPLAILGRRWKGPESREGDGDSPGQPGAAVELGQGQDPHMASRVRYRALPYLIGAVAQGCDGGRVQRYGLGTVGQRLRAPGVSLCCEPGREEREASQQVHHTWSSHRWK